MIIEANLLPDARMASLLNECDELCRIIGESLVTVKRNAGRMP